ncbi:putative cytochrome P450 [Podospora appendiculata]|uniref:Cytochrome P450 n=1 Tax=Podospora appendiculata TaxID=314037 RepID=A0AAE0XAH2_9PEZI|nr:putative cytochrome P450 [Podospora appendiculata]
MILSLILALAAAYIAWNAIRLELNVRKARALDVHIVRIPFDVNNNVWVIVQPLVWKLLARVLPNIPWTAYPDVVRFSHRNWYFQEKSSTALRFGRVWALVSPGNVHLQVSDPDVIRDMCSRWRDFSRPVRIYKMLAVYGPSVVTVGLQDWPRHRKAVATTFNESINQFVWDESLRQALSMVQYWTSTPNDGIPDMEEDVRSLSLNVLAATAFREPYAFRGSTQLIKDADEGDKVNNTRTYRDALRVVNKHAILLMLIPYRYLASPIPIIPRALARIGRAAVALRGFLTSMVAEEMQALNRGEDGSGGLMTHLVRSALDQETAHRIGFADEVKTASKKGLLSFDEILGNVFLINFAGHDTTAVTLSFAMMLLAARPDVQQWLHEEIVTVSEGKPVTDWDYHDLFPKLHRCRAVFLETLRLYAPIIGLPKLSSDKAQTLHVPGRDNSPLVIPPGSEIYPLILCVQTDPKYWPDEPFAWKPSRWITVTSEGDGLFVPEQGSYLPWADGPQGCPGKKFSQVEAVAVLAGLFRRHRVRPVPGPGETEEQARKRAQDCADDVNYDLLLRMNHADGVRLQVVEMDG